MECFQSSPGESATMTYSSSDDQEGGEDIAEIQMNDITEVQMTCAVCDMKANGMYFGAMVCLPCKSFFIRCTKECEPKFTCLSHGLCNITKGNRLRCQHCRFKKCLTVGMCRKEKPEIIEPQEGQELCKVCADIANGIHFGVPTCEGCKKFFRRALKESNTYFCKYERRCVLNPRNRNSCRYCRYQKCLDVGMSRNAFAAIRMGRPKKALEKLSLRAAELHAGRERTNSESSVRDSRYTRRHSPYYVMPPDGAQSLPNETSQVLFQEDIKPLAVLQNTSENSPQMLTDQDAMTAISFQTSTDVIPSAYSNRQQIIPLGSDMVSIDSPCSSDSSASSYASNTDVIVDIEEDLNNILCTLQQFPDSLIPRTTVQSIPFLPTSDMSHSKFTTAGLNSCYSLENQVTSVTSFIHYPEMKQEPADGFTSHCKYSAGQTDMQTDSGISSPANAAVPYCVGNEWDGKANQSLYTQMYDSLMTAYNIGSNDENMDNSYSLSDPQRKTCMT